MIRKMDGGARWNLGPWLNDLKLIGKGAEIGTMNGEFAKDLLSTWRGEKLYVIDAWREFEFWKDDICANRKENMNRMCVCYEKLYEFGERACMMREISEDAATRFKTGELDFVYIDAAHEYLVDRGDGKMMGIKQDIDIWAPKVRKGGVIAGHDYLNGWTNNTYFEVKRAVDEFAKANNYEILVTSDDVKLNPSWIIRT